MDTAISLSQVSFQYKGADHPAISQITWSLGRGQCAVIQGDSASGKTTLCRCLNGLIPQALEGLLQGEIVVAGKDVSCFRTQTLAREIGFVMQDPETQIVGRTVFEDLAFGPANMGYPVREIQEKVRQALADVGLEGYEHRDTAQLSGGEKQRLAIAGILAMSPAILILDEPASELDPRGRAELYRRLDRLRRSRGITLVLVERQIRDILPMVDQVLVLDKGKVISHGPPGQGDHIMPPAPSGAGTTAWDERQEQPILEINDLTFGYTPERQVLKDISIRIHRGEFLAVMGHNGAGKTTLIKHLNGLLPSGRVTLKGTPITRLSIKDRAGAIGFVFQNPDHQIFEDSVEKEIAFGLKQIGMTAEGIRDRVAQVMKDTELTPYAATHPFTLPKGMRQMVAVASAAAIGPAVLVVDEPFTGLDREGSRRVMDMILALHRNGTAVVLITHDLDLAARHASRLAVMAEGELIGTGPMAELLEQEELLVRAGLVPGSCDPVR